MFNRVFLVVLDSLGVGELPDSHLYNDSGSNTLLSLYKSGKLNVPTLEKLGLFNIDNIGINSKINPIGAYGKFAEISCGKDSITGHWEIAGVVPEYGFPTFVNGFPQEVVDMLIKAWGVTGILCNKPYSGTEVIKDYGIEHIKTKKPIIYTSSDSVLQIACHENVYSREELYNLCKIARELMVGKYNIGRVIARPFLGESPTGENAFYRTEGRKDYSVYPPKDTILNLISNKGLQVISVGKVSDIFCKSGITEIVKAKTNKDSKKGLLYAMQKDFKGLCFANFIDFDTLYGHRNDILGYVAELNDFDVYLSEVIKMLKDDDLLLITADHGCDPATPSTDHSREYIPLLAYSKNINPVNLHIGNSFADIGATICDNFNIKLKIGDSFLNKIIKS